jgi:hypothetical protein
MLYQVTIDWITYDTNNLDEAVHFYRAHKDGAKHGNLKSTKTNEYYLYFNPFGEYENGLI